MGKLKVLFVYANCMLDNLIPVSASSIISVLKREGIDVQLFDTTFYRTEERPPDIDRVENLQVLPFDYSSIGISLKEEDFLQAFRQKVIEYKPDLLMLSVVEVTYKQAVQLLESIKDIRPFTLVGGVFAIMVPQEVIDNPYIDAICISEGEDAVAEFCSKYSKGEDYTYVAGMWFKTNNGVVANPTKGLVNLDTIPFLDFSLYEKERFYKPMQGKIFRMVPIEFSRGCPYHCTYCVNHALEEIHKPSGKWFRWKSMDRIFAEIDYFVNHYKVEFFYFISESFLSMPWKKFDEFCSRYQKYKIPFWFNTMPETIKKDKVAKLEEINCFRMGIGLEHGNYEFRKAMLNRKVTNEKMVEACRIVENSKITYSINNIIGFPGETRELVFDTINLNKQIKPDSVGTFVFTPFKGTELYDYCLKHGYINPETEVGDLNRGSVLHNNTLSPQQIKGLLRTFPLYIHFDEEYYPLIEKAEQFNEEGNSIFQRLAAQYRDEHFNERVK